MSDSDTKNELEDIWDNMVDPDESVWELKKRLSLKALIFSNHYVEHRNADAAYKHAYSRNQAGRSAHDLMSHPDVIKYIIARLRAKECTIEDAFESSVERLQKLALDDSDRVTAIAAHKILHDTKTKLRDISAKMDLKAALYCKPQEEKAQSININITTVPPEVVVEDTEHATEKNDTPLLRRHDLI